MSVEPQRLQRLLGDDDLRWLLTRIRQRIERGQPLEGQITLNGASLAQRRAVERLSGRPVGGGRPVGRGRLMGRGRTMSIRLTALDALVVRAGAAPDLRSAVEALTGVLTNWGAEREAAAQSWPRATAALERAVAARAELEPWLVRVRATGMLQRVGRGDPEVAYELAGRAERILTRLPANGVPLSVLASEAGGDEQRSTAAGRFRYCYCARPHARAGFQMAKERSGGARCGPPSACCVVN